MDRRQTEKIGKVLTQYFVENNLNNPLNELQIKSAWSELMGETIQYYTANLFVKNGTLHVKLTSAVLRNELFSNRTLIIQKINNYIGRSIITQINFY